MQEGRERKEEELERKGENALTKKREWGREYESATWDR